MKKLGKMLRKSIVFCFVMILICAFIYPFALTGISQLTMKNKANGNLIDKNGEPISNAEEAVGSELIGQDFTEDYFFHGRVSAVNYNTYTEEQKENGEYSGVASGGSNYGNSNPELEKRMEKDLETFLKEHEVMIAALTLPKSKAVKVAEKLVDLGIKALWNFAPVDLHFSEDILVENVHLAESIMTLSYRIHSHNQ